MPQTGDIIQLLAYLTVSHAGVVELADTPDLGSGAARLGGSSPPSRILHGYFVFLVIAALSALAVTLEGCSLSRAPQAFNPAVLKCDSSQQLSDPEVQSFLQPLLIKTEQFKAAQRRRLLELGGILKDQREDPLTREDNSSELLFFDRGDTFPSVRLTSSKGHPSIVRLDPYLRSQGIESLSKVSIAPDSGAIALIGFAPATESDVLLVINPQAPKADIIIDHAFDVVWGDRSTIFFSVENSLRPSKVFKMQLGRPMVGIRTTGTSYESLLLSKSRDSSAVFIEVSRPHSSDLFAYTALDDFKESAAVLDEPPGSRMTAIKKKIFYLSFKNNSAGEIRESSRAHPVHDHVLMRGSRDSVITSLDSFEDLLLAFTSTGTSSGVSIINPVNGSIKAFDPLGPNTTLSPSVATYSQNPKIITTNSFLSPSQSLSLKELEATDSPLKLSSHCQTCVERALFAPSTDGTLVPISMVLPPAPKGLAVFAYGAYGISTFAKASPYVSLLLNQNVAVAIVHVRGGGELGPRWHLAGTGVNKMRSIEDLAASIRFIHSQGIGHPAVTILEGRSAGGWLAAMTASLHPQLFRGIILEAPLLDLRGVLLEEKNPLVERDRAEWAHDPAALESLSPLSRINSAYSASTFVIVGLRDQLIPGRGTVEWIRRAACASGSPSQFVVALLPGGTHEGSRQRHEQEELIALKTLFITHTISAGAEN